MRCLGQRLLWRVEEVRVRALAPTANPTSQLVQLRQPESVRPLDDEGVGIGDVDAALDDGGANQYVELLLPEADDDVLERVLGHLAMRRLDPRLRHELAEPLGDAINRLDTVVDVEDLTFPKQFAADRCSDLFFVIRP